MLKILLDFVFENKDPWSFQNTDMTHVFRSSIILRETIEKTPHDSVHNLKWASLQIVSQQLSYQKYTSIVNRTIIIVFRIKHGQKKIKMYDNEKICFVYSHGIIPRL